MKGTVKLKHCSTTHLHVYRHPWTPGEDKKTYLGAEQILPPNTERQWGFEVRRNRALTYTIPSFRWRTMKSLILIRSSYQKSMGFWSFSSLSQGFHEEKMTWQDSPCLDVCCAKPLGLLRPLLGMHEDVWTKMFTAWKIKINIWNS